jgi:predicted phage terminase large subunit-like protein
MSEQLNTTPSVDQLQKDLNAVTRLAIKAARDDFLMFVMLMEESFDVGPHHRLIADAFMDLEAGRDLRTSLSVAPRSSKSLMFSVYGPAWALGRHPTWTILLISHSADLAGDWGLRIRDVIMSEQYKVVFPNVTIRKDKRAASEWALDQGGKFLAAGAGTNIAGRGAHLALVDDPISEQTAWSKAARNQINNWYPGGLRSRLTPSGRLAIIQTRWHEEDLTGYLVKQSMENPFADQFRIISIPALNSNESAAILQEARNKLVTAGILPEDYPEMLPGESFFPGTYEAQATKGVDRIEYCWPTPDLIATKNNMPPFQWDALYMQNPTNQAGNILLAEWWKDWTDDDPPECLFKVQSYDTAFSTRTTADYSAVTTWGIFVNEETGKYDIICLGAQKERLDYPSLRDLFLKKYDEHQPDQVIIEKKASGQSLIQDMRALGLPIYPYNPDRDKVARAHSVSPIFQSGRIWIPCRKSWASDIINECRQFPSGPHDDYVDTVTQVLIWFRASGWAETDADMTSDWRDAKTERKKRRYY